MQYQQYSSDGRSLSPSTVSLRVRFAPDVCPISLRGVVMCNRTTLTLLQESSSMSTYNNSPRYTQRPEEVNRQYGNNGAAPQHRFLGVCSVPLLQFFRQDKRVSITRGATFLFDNAAVTSDIQLAGGSSRDSNPGLWENLVMQCHSMAEADLLVEALVQGHAEEILNPPLMPDNVSEVLRSRSTSRRRGRPQSSEEDISPVSRDALPPPPPRRHSPVEEERRSPKPKPRRSPSTVSTRSSSHRHRKQKKVIPEEEVEDMFREFMKFEHHRQHLLLYMHKELVHQAYNAAEAGVLAAEASKTYSAAEKERLQQIEDKLNETEELYKEVKAERERLNKAKKELEEERRRMANEKPPRAAAQPATATRNMPPPQDYEESYLGHLPSNANLAERELRRVIPGRSWESAFFPECEDDVRHGAIIDIATATKLPRSLISLQQVKPITRDNNEEERRKNSKGKKKNSRQKGYENFSSDDDDLEEGLLVVAKVKYNEETHDGDAVERRLNRCGFPLLEQMYANRDAFHAVKEEKRRKDPRLRDKHSADRRAIRDGSRSSSVTSSSHRGSSHGHRHRRPGAENGYDKHRGDDKPRRGQPAITDAPAYPHDSQGPYQQQRDPAYRAPPQNGAAFPSQGYPGSDPWYGRQPQPQPSSSNAGSRPTNSSVSPYQQYPYSVQPQQPISNGYGYGGGSSYPSAGRAPGNAVAPYPGANRPLTSSTPTLGLLQSNEAVDRAVVEVAEARQRRIIMTAHRHRLALLELQERERTERRRLEREQEPLERLAIQSKAQPLKYYPDAQQAVLKAEALHRDKIYRSEDQARQKLQYQGGQLMAKGVVRAREALFKDENAERVLIESEALSKTLDLIAYDQRYRDREAANRINRNREQARRKEQMFEQLFESLMESEREERQTIVRSEARLRPVLRQEMQDEEEALREKKILKEKEILQQQKEEQNRLMEKEQQYRREVEEDEERARERLRLSEQEEHQRQKQLEDERAILTPNYRDPSAMGNGNNHKTADLTSRESTYTEGDSSYSRRRRLDSQRRVKPFHYMTFSPEDMDFKPNAESAIEGILGCTINRNLEVVEISRRLPKATDEEGEFQAGDMILDASGQSLHSISHLREVLSHRIMLIQEEARMEFPDIPEEELTTNPALQKYIEVLCEHHNFLMQVLRGCDIYQLIVKS